MKLHYQSDRQTAACFTLVHLPGSYPPAPLRHFVALFPSRGRKGWRRSPFFHLYPIKIAFSQKFRLPVGIFSFPENILYVENFRHKKRPGSRSFSFSFITKTPDSSHADAR
nr:hypothetical protein [uncultured Dialister sp.]